MELEKDTFYPVEHPVDKGLVAVTSNLSVDLVLHGYPRGMFPWISQDGLFYWFSPDPRMVLFLDELKISRSMRNILNRNQLHVSFNKAFNQVIHRCAQVPRKGQESTWITRDFIETYTRLHQLGIVKSVEVWNDRKLVGGLIWPGH